MRLMSAYLSACGLTCKFRLEICVSGRPGDWQQMWTGLIPIYSCQAKAFQADVLASPPSCPGDPHLLVPEKPFRGAVTYALIPDTRPCADHPWHADNPR